MPIDQRRSGAGLFSSLGAVPMSYNAARHTVDGTNCGLKRNAQSLKRTFILPDQPRAGGASVIGPSTGAGSCADHPEEAVVGRHGGGGDDALRVPRGDPLSLLCRLVASVPRPKLHTVLRRARQREQAALARRADPSDHERGHVRRGCQGRVEAEEPHAGGSQAGSPSPADGARRDRRDRLEANAGSTFGLVLRRVHRRVVGGRGLRFVLGERLCAEHRRRNGRCCRWRVDRGWRRERRFRGCRCFREGTLRGHEHDERGAHALGAAQRREG